MSPSTRSSNQRDGVHGPGTTLELVDQARLVGARVVHGGAVPSSAGAFYEPTLIVDAAQDSEIVQQVVFGPVLVVLPFVTDDEGIAPANDSPYGLAGSAWTGSVFRAQRASREIQAGCVRG